jgi:hypothetical protein
MVFRGEKNFLIFSCGIGPGRANFPVTGAGKAPDELFEDSGPNDEFSSEKAGNKQTGSWEMLITRSPAKCIFRRNPLKKALLIAGLAAALAAAGGPAAAWSTLAGSWWQPTAFPSAADTAVFSLSSLTASRDGYLGGNQSALGLTFSSTAGTTHLRCYFLEWLGRGVSLEPFLPQPRPESRDLLCHDILHSSHRAHRGQSSVLFPSFQFPGFQSLVSAMS